MGHELNQDYVEETNFILNYVQDTLYEVSIMEEECSIDTVFARTKKGFQELSLEQLFIGDSACLNHVLRNKTILIGHIGSECIDNYYYDGEDKFAVPSNKDILYRPKTMPGVLVHANAVQNIVNPNVLFECWSDKRSFLFLEELLLLAYLAFLLFARAGKLLNILMMFALSVPILYLVLLAMEYHLYFEIGTTLLQFLVFEELVEIVEPIYTRIKYNLESKLNELIQ
jgi:CHASE2 domain-containing sensor protein